MLNHNAKQTQWISVHINQMLCLRITNYYTFAVLAKLLAMNSSGLPRKLSLILWWVSYVTIEKKPYGSLRSPTYGAMLPLQVAAVWLGHKTFSEVKTAIVQ